MSETKDHLRGDPVILSHSVERASERTGLPVATIWALIAAGELQTAKVGRRRLVLDESLRAFLERHRVKQGEAA